ncbi:MAG: hypothetical protein EOP55_06545 [Sphingobacteriales bacterium]|nr:MAG: hypothetical protein EOP55_06545 [Sphingobacteriales bacterium]
MRVILTTVLLTISSYAFSQKAFEFAYYYGKTKNFEIKLSLANGYILGSEIIKTDIKTGKKVRYFPNEVPGKNGHSLVFLPDSNDKTIRIRKRDNIILHNIKEDYENLPGKINGIYGIDLKTYSFKLHHQSANH